MSGPPPARGLTLMRWVAAIVSGALLTVVAPPMNLHWLHWFVFLPVLWSLREGEGRRNAKLGYLSGFVGLSLLFSWLGETMVRFSNLPWPVAGLVIALFASVFALPYALVFGSVHWLRQRFGRGWVWIFPAVQVAIERLSPALFPYYHGVSQYRVPWMWQLASVTGVTGLTFLVFLVNAVLAEALIYRRRSVGTPAASVPWRHLVAVAALMGATLGFGAWRHAAIETLLAAAPVKRVALLQTDLQMDDRRLHKRRDIVKLWVEQTAKVVPEHPDLVIWPEGAFPENPTDPDAAEFLGTLASQGHFDLLVGGGTFQRNPPGSVRRYTAFNSAYHIDPSGAVRERYDKMVPLPFGEYMPFSDTFPVLKDLIEGIGDFQAGTVPTIFHTADYSFSVPICYEAILVSQMWKMKDADVFINITNDAWFGDTAAPWQHAMLAAVQSMQFGRPMVRVAYTGVDMIVEPHGDIRYETQPFKPEAKVVDLRLAHVDTVYARGGWIFPWACVLVAGLSLVVGRRRPVTPTPSAS